MLQRAIAQIISAVFHPVFLIQIIFQVVIFSQPALSSPGRLADSMSVFFFLLLVPLVSTKLLIRTGRVTSWEMPVRHERTIPYLIMGFFSAVTFFVFWMTQTAGVAGLLPLFGILLMGVVLVINAFWKISIHLLGMGGLSAFVFCSVKITGSATLILLVLGLLLAGFLTAWARFKLKAHNPAQLLAGWIVGFLTTLLFFVQAG